MNTKTLYGLIAAAVIALAAAWWINRAQRPLSEAPGQDRVLLPGFRDQVNDVDTVTLTGADAKVLATLKRGSHGWGIVEKAGYPADVAKLREFLLKLADASVLESKTSNPKLYPELGVEDVKAKDAKGVLVTLAGAKQPFKLIVGNFNGAGGGGTFVRREGDAQSLLVKGNLSVDKNTADWEKKDIADIAATRIRAVTITRPDGSTLQVHKDQPGDANFKVADVPKGREVSSDFVANPLGAGLAGLRVDDVFPAQEAAPGPDEKVYKVHYAAFDGLIVDATAWVRDGKDYARFQASLDDSAAAAHVEVEQAKAKADYDAAVQAANKNVAEGKPASGPEADAKAKAASAAQVNKPLALTDPEKDKQERLKALHDEVATLNGNFSGWTFVLPNYKFSNIDKGMDDMLKPQEDKKAAAKETKKPAKAADGKH
jgi:hypothetical protein